MNSESKKIAILSHILPPSPSGQATVLYQLLKNYVKDSYCLISLKSRAASTRNSGTEKLNANYYNLSHIRLPYRLSFLNTPFMPITNILLRLIKMKKILKSEKCSALVVCTGDLYNVPAAYLASKACKIPFAIYMFDDYVHQWTGLNRIFSKFVASIIFKKAKGIIVPNEFLQADYLKDFEVQTNVIHNPCEIPDVNKLKNSKYKFDTNGINIIYTGTIYAAQLSAVKNLVEAVNMLDDKIKVYFHVFTSTSKASLTKDGVVGKNVIYHEHVKQADIMDIQASADILFLPLAFNSDYPEVIRTSAPGKTGEYLSVGKPIIVHAPKGSFISSYFKENKCGMVVDEDNVEQLAKAILKLVEDKNLSTLLGENARRVSINDFSLNIIQEKFNKFLKAL
ncbi:glycosyltransferase family 4 protein [Clostridium swellfunianum]|uniref:glycosyltransferase family 4 protein n=1 Tax=Clostridium swellfunianum TaxID=1367462 RepID=UPI00202EB87D|nr:glycosyltransferase family 4 protein [Clostridium swellfunianum]MCM0647438.1 glycosyltransferase family 4 protein [Clostridium swellfunianum]